MWSVNISVSPCSEAERIGYDSRQINRIVVRCAQYFLNRDMRVIFGHDWREDGVMRAVAEFAGKVATSATTQSEEQLECNRVDIPRMLNIVPTARGLLSKMALDAKSESGGALEVVSTSPEGRERLSMLTREVENLCWNDTWLDNRPTELTMLRQWITAVLDPGCRICLGGKLEGYEGNEPGIVEEARFALQFNKPLYLLGGFGGAAKRFGEMDEYGRTAYWHADNGLSPADKRELFHSTDIERALRIISGGIEKCKDTT